jgi:hypothetical protein
MKNEECISVLRVLYSLPYRYENNRSFVPLVEINKEINKHMKILWESKEGKQLYKELFQEMTHGNKS